MRRKLGLGFFTIIILLWAICAYTIWSNMAVRETFVDLKDDIVPDAIAMSEMKYTATEIRMWTLTYIIRGNAIRDEKRIKEWLQEEWAALEEAAKEHLEHESGFGPEEQRAAEEIMDLTQKLIFVSREIIDLKDKDVGNEELFKKVRKEFGLPIFYPLRKALDEHTAKHFEKLTAAEAMVQDKHEANIRYIIIFGLAITLLALFIGISVDRLFIKYITDRNQAEEALRETTDYLQNLLDYANAPIIVWNHEFLITRFNHAFERLTQKNADEVLGKPLDILFPENSREEAMTHIRRAIMGERWEVLEIPIRCADGKVRTVLWNSATIFDTDGTTIVAIIAQGQDITERKRAGEALQKSEKRFKDISFSMADWIWEVDEKGVYTYCSEKIQEILGYSQNEVLGKTPFDFMPPEEAEKIASIFKGILDQKKPIKDLENWNIARDGRKICLLTNGIPLLDTDGNITGYRGVDKDITKRKLAEEALASEKERLAVTLASIGDGVIATDTNGKVLIFNKIAESLTGWTEEEAFGKPLSEVFHIKNEQTQKICENPVELVLRLGKVIGLANNTVLVSRDGTERIIADSGAPILDKKGNILGVVLVFHDVTETRRLQELATRAQRLETAGRIAGQVAHDFNNLLGPLVAFPELAREELAPNHQVIKYIDAMEKSAKKIADINQQLLTLGRRGHYGQVTLNLNEIITDIINQISHSGKIRIIRNLHQNLMNIKGGPAQIHRIIANLINNAIDAMQDRGELTVKTENYYVEDSMGKYGRIPKGEYAKITISDTGSGIPEKIMSKIFDPFFTTKKTDKQRGSGLGLSVVHAVVEDHGGFIDLESEVGKGTSFYLYFPITREDIETVEENYVPGGRESILIIDDDPVQRDVSIKLLGKLGYEIRTVESGEKAAELVKEKVYDLLILDMIMPNGIDGAETYKRILESNPYQKAVIVSGFAQTDRVNMALDLGASEYILKPLTIKSIARAIRKALDEKKESPVK